MIIFNLQVRKLRLREVSRVPRCTQLGSGGMKDQPGDLVLEHLLGKWEAGQLWLNAASFW